jgi:hypothetical protein
VYLFSFFNNHSLFRQFVLIIIVNTTNVLLTFRYVTCVISLNILMINAQHNKYGLTCLLNVYTQELNSYKQELSWRTELSTGLRHS